MVLVKKIVFSAVLLAMSVILNAQQKPAGQAQDANAILIPKEDADEAMDCASCIGCGACVAACKNGSAMLFVSSKVSQLALLPQGRVEAARRVNSVSK